MLCFCSLWDSYIIEYWICCSLTCAMLCILFILSAHTLAGIIDFIAVNGTVSFCAFILLTGSQDGLLAPKKSHLINLLSFVDEFWCQWLTKD